MRRRSIALALGASAIISTAAAAAAPPLDVLFAGRIDRSYAQSPNPATGFQSLCVIDGAQSSFMRKAAPVAKLISLPDIMITPNGSLGPEAYTVGGQARLTFDAGSTTAGRIAFAPVADYPPAIRNPRFNKYRENYEPTDGTLTVTFTIRFEFCELPVSATYRN